MSKVIRLALRGEKIKVIKFYCQGWDKTPFEVGSEWEVIKSVDNYFGTTFCEGANGVILKGYYVVIE